MLVAIYTRVSTMDQARDGYSLEAQQHTLTKWCVSHGHDVYNIYSDKGISGKDIAHRPAMRRMLQDAKAEKFGAILVWALSRFTRSVGDLYDTLNILEDLGIELISYTESFDTATPMGRAMMGVAGIFGQLERELTAERVIVAMTERAAQGKRTCNEVLGYDLDGTDGLKINPIEAERVRYIFERYVEYKNLSAVAELCRIQGYVGKRGKSPNPWSIYIILTRPVYCGYNLFRGVLYKGNQEPIVSVQTYNRVQRLLLQQNRHGKRKPMIIKQRRGTNDE